MMVRPQSFDEVLVANRAVLGAATCAVDVGGLGDPAALLRRSLFVSSIDPVVHRSLAIEALAAGDTNMFFGPFYDAVDDAVDSAVGGAVDGAVRPFWFSTDPTSGFANAHVVGLDRFAREVFEKAAERVVSQVAAYRCRLVEAGVLVPHLMVVKGRVDGLWSLRPALSVAAGREKDFGRYVVWVGSVKALVSKMSVFVAGERFQPHAGVGARRRHARFVRSKLARLAP